MLKEKYSLSWHDYSEHLKSMMKEFMMNENFSDVTLVTDDKIHINANIDILSACSPVFRNILKKEKNYNQIMYLRGILFSEMESIMQFIYLGEATFYEERMGEFLAVAKSLEITGLCNTLAESNDESNEAPPQDPESSTEDSKEQTVIPLNLKQGSEERREQGVDKKQKNEQTKSVLEDMKYACNQCENQFTSLGYLNVHIKAKHEGIKYDCRECDQKFSSQNNLYVHNQSIHEGIRHACDQCDFQASQTGVLSRHKKSKHEGVRYACAHCDYQASRQDALSRHIKSTHKTVHVHNIKRGGWKSRWLQ